MFVIFCGGSIHKDWKLPSWYKWEMAFLARKDLFQGIVICKIKIFLLASKWKELYFLNLFYIMVTHHIYNFDQHYFWPISMWNHIFSKVSGTSGSKILKKNWNFPQKWKVKYNRHKSAGIELIMQLQWYIRLPVCIFLSLLLRGHKPMREYEQRHLGDTSRIAITLSRFQVSYINRRGWMIQL